MSAPLPPNEDERLRELERYEVLDTLPEAAFDDLVQLAADICGTPIALLSLVDANRQWFKSAVGLNVKETPRSVAFCAHAILDRQLFVVPDAADDDRFARNPLVTGSPHLRFYAGAPIQTLAGPAIGTVCVLDHVPRELTPFQARALRTIGDQVQTQLELRRHIQELARSEEQVRKERDRGLRLREEADELRSFVLHDLKNALATLGPNAEFLVHSDQLGEDEAAAAQDLQEGAERMKTMVKELLDSRSLDSGRLVVRLGDVDARALVLDVARIMRRRVEAAGQRLVLRLPDEHILIRGDEALLSRVLENLLDNALKYGCSLNGVLAIEVSSQPSSVRARITVDDQGAGVPAAARERIFERNTRLDRDAGAPTDQRSSYGIGLAFCRTAVEAHAGRIWVEDHPPVGARFVLDLPLTTLPPG